MATGFNERLSEGLAVVSCIDPDAYTAAAYNGDVIDMQKYKRVMFIVQAGALGTSATLDWVLKGDTASGGSYSTTITGKSITQLTEAGTDSDKQVIVEVTAEEVAAQGFRYIRETLTVGTATSDAGSVAVGFGMRYSPASEFDLASVDEIVA